MHKEQYLTPEGEKRLQAELEDLRGPAREKIAKRLRSAIQMGDLSENADYITAKEDQGFLEGRIQELEYILRYATIIENNHNHNGTVEIGTTITIQEEDYPPEVYYLVGTAEADPTKGRISNESPIGEAIMGKKVGALVKIETPSGELCLRIVDIK